MNRLTLTPSGFKHYTLTEDFNSYCKYANGTNIIVPKGFRTDLASVPRIFWTILPPFGRYSQAAVVHDYLYRMEHDKKEADLIFYYLMLNCDVYYWKAKVMYWAVKYFSWLKF